MTSLIGNQILSVGCGIALVGIALVARRCIHRSARLFLPLALGVGVLFGTLLLADALSRRESAEDTRAAKVELRSLQGCRTGSFVVMSAFVLLSGLEELLRRRRICVSGEGRAGHPLRRAVVGLLLLGSLYVLSSAPVIRWQVRIGGSFWAVYPFYYPVMKTVETPGLGVPLGAYFKLWGIRYGNGTYSIRH